MNGIDSMDSMDIFGRRQTETKEGIPNVVNDTGRRCVYFRENGKSIFHPTVILFDKDRETCLLYMNEEANYPTLYKITSPPKDDLWIEGSFLEDFTDKLIGDDTFLEIKAKNFAPVGLRNFKMAMLKCRCMNETDNLIENIQAQAKLIQENLTTMTSDDGIRTAKVYMEEILDLAKGYSKETTGGFMKELEWNLQRKELREAEQK